MKFLLLLFPFLSNCFTTFSQKINFSLEGKTFYKEGIARLSMLQNSRSIQFDSAFIVNGVFRMKGTIDEPKIFFLSIGKQERSLFIGNEKIVVEQTDSVSNMKISGSPLTKDNDEYEAKYHQAVVSAYINIEQKISGLDSTNQKVIDSLRELQATSFRTYPFLLLEFVRTHPASFLSLNFLNYYSEVYPVDTLKYYYTLLSKNLKHYPSAKFVEEKILLGSNKTAKCPSFKVLDTANKVVSLQTFKGNYLIIDFWASWCVPCIENIPFIQRAALKFESKNLKVLTVSLDRNDDAWKAALIKYGLHDICRNVLLVNAFRHPMALQFNVSSIPFNVLINPNGEIIAKNLSGPDLLAKLEKIFTRN